LEGGWTAVIFIGGISQGQKILDYVKTVICDRCGAYGRYQVMMTYMYFSFFFIPLFKWNKKFYVKMSCCEAVYELDPEKGKALARGQQADITQADLTLVQEGNRRSSYENGSYKVWKKCVRCGYETEEDFEYCPKCGGRL
jgi:hypothetical protein